MIAAPLTASILGDYGAEVIKIELPGTGDTVRMMGPQRNGSGLVWRTLGRNKESVMLDLRVKASQELLLRWLPRFDVLVENFRPGNSRSLQSRHRSASHRQPASCHPAHDSLREDGPYRNRQGFGTLAETMSGSASVLLKGLRGLSSDRPALTSYPLADVTAGLAGANGVLAALLHAQRTGRGDVVDVAIYEAMLKFMELEILAHEGEDETSSDDATAEPRRPDSSSPRGLSLR